MPIEIERKFLLSSREWEAGVIRVDVFRDGLLARFAGGKVRIRQSADRAWITVKGLRVGLRRAEYEYEVPPEEAEEMLALCDGPLIEKHRHLVAHAGVTWAVDVHFGLLAGIEFAEVELEHPQQELSLPSWVGREVTNDPRYSKRNLIQLREGTVDSA